MPQKILLVDDDLTLNQMYQERLEMEGYNVLSAKDGQQAIELAKIEKPDIVLLDIMMPGIDGFQVLDELKRDPDTMMIPVVVVTALIQETVKIKGKQMGASDYVIKSETTPAQLVAKIKEYLTSKQPLKDLEQS